VDDRTEAGLVEAVTGAAFQLSRRLGFRGAPGGPQSRSYGG
jgi:hypothetical protein